jgi:hypothetical protein
MSIDPEVERACQKMAEAAQDMLTGKLSFIEGARLICSLRLQSGLPHDDPDLLTFVLIESKTDALPLGTVRDLRASSALEELRPKIERSEKWAEETGRSACQNLVDRAFGRPYLAEKFQPIVDAADPRHPTRPPISDPAAIATIVVWVVIGALAVVTMLGGW